MFLNRGSFFVLIAVVMLAACGGAGSKSAKQDIDYETIIQSAEKAEAAKAASDTDAGKPATATETELKAVVGDQTSSPTVDNGTEADEGSSRTRIPEVIKAPTATTPTTTTPAVTASEAAVKEKISYTNMMLTSKIGKRIEQSNNPDAKNLLNASREKYNQAKTVLAQGDANTAMSQINDALRLINQAAILVPSEGLVEEQKKAYESLGKELTAARELHERNYSKIVKSKGASAGVKYDVKEVDRLAGAAADLATRKDYQKAGERLIEAQNLVHAAINKMLDAQTITYEIDVSTPEGEYRYEYDRYLGYEELIPVAIEQQTASAEQMAYVERSMEKAKKMRDDAIEKAKAGDYPVAIRMIMDAAQEVRRALRIMGVKE